jgi:hypothetical protein
MTKNEKLELKTLRKLASIQNNIIGGLCQRGHNLKYLTDQETEKDKSNDKEFQELKSESVKRIVDILTDNKRWDYYGILDKGEQKVYDFCKELLREEDPS